ncbi:MAG: glucose-6-phosphate dehydrogenase [Chlamydiae bacterium]|nr:glucose-6-phosphate dehydrogenase [Chlamydiota bacterium]
MGQPLGIDKEFQHHRITNPFEEGLLRKPKPAILTIFGATGDLAHKKLFPALYMMMRQNQLSTNFAIVGIGRRDKTLQEFREEMCASVRKYARIKPVDDTSIQSFSERLFYFKTDIQDPKGYEALSNFLKELDIKLGTQGNRLHYLSVQPEIVTTIVENLAKSNLIYKPNGDDRFSRVIIEKPFGHDLNSAKELQNTLRQYLEEDQIYRIDHYLGKETVQNLLVFRFANILFESIWNNRYIDHVQITVAEDIGIGSRAGFYEKEGLFRDIMQNHFIQLLCLMAMEPPANLISNSIRDEKVKVLQCLRQFSKEDMEKYVVRGQYTEGLIKGERVASYRNELNVDKHSDTATFGAMRLFIDNMRWSGVPFYARAGKRLPKRCTEISLFFKKMPEILFFKDMPHHPHNVLSFRIQPEEGIHVLFNCKVPGQSTIQSVKMNFEYTNYFGDNNIPEAYERLISDSLLGDSTLFARCDESINSWEFFEPILEHMEKIPLSQENFYASGSWGPKAADEMIQRDQRAWKNL